MNDVFKQMDSMYRHQRYFYDATRKFYLLGRDQLIERMTILPGENIAEIGCGTGRNLEILARRFPNANFFGLDASSEMLLTASAKCKNAKLDNIKLKTALADDLDHSKTFGINDPFDAIFFSYAISMIPRWREAIDRAIANLKPQGKMYIVDFYDQKDLPAWFQTLLKAWLRQFHVQFWGELIPFLFSLQQTGLGTLTLDPIARRYAFIASFQKA